jgi:pimeloyl-ACP methyl ester carboxylesterase
MTQFQPRVLALLALACGCTNTTMNSNVPARDLPLHIECRGEGHPTVVLEAGLGNDSSVWSSVIPDVARTSQVCAYDRAGMGASRRAAPRPHSNEMMAAELHELLRAARIPEPYVLVGHSMGGANVRYFAAKSPDAVSGVVLVDSMSEHQPSRLWALFPEATFSDFKRGLEKLPEGVDFDTLSGGLERLATVNPSLGELPLVVLAHGKPIPPPPGVSPARATEMEAAWRTMQEDLARLSSNSAYAVVENAGHHIQLDRPDVVVGAVNEVIDSVRTHRPLNPGAIAGN